MQSSETEELLWLISMDLQDCPKSDTKTTSDYNGLETSCMCNMSCSHKWISYARIMVKNNMVMQKSETGFGEGEMSLVTFQQLLWENKYITATWPEKYAVHNMSGGLHTWREMLQ